MLGMRPTLRELCTLARAGDQRAARRLADRLLAADKPPGSTAEFVMRLAPVAGRLDGPLFDLLADAFDEARLEQAIRGLPEAAHP